MKVAVPNRASKLRLLDALFQLEAAPLRDDDDAEKKARRNTANEAVVFANNLIFQVDKLKSILDDVSNIGGHGQQLLHTGRGHASIQRGSGFKSCQVVGFSFPLYPVSSASSIQVLRGGATLLNFVEKYA